MGLRLLSETDWADFAETISVVEQVLRNDPVGIYPRMHFNTRDHYRHVVEILAVDSGLSEPEVADRVLALSEKNAPDTPEYHVGYYLAGEGRQELETHLLADTSRLIRLRHSFNRITLLSWLGSGVVDHRNDRGNIARNSHAGRGLAVDRGDIASDYRFNSVNE